MSAGEAAEGAAGVPNAPPAVDQRFKPQLREAVPAADSPATESAQPAGDDPGREAAPAGAEGATDEPGTAPIAEGPRLAEAQGESAEQLGQKARELVVNRARNTFTGEKTADMNNPRERSLRLLQVISEVGTDPAKGENPPNWDFKDDPPIAISFTYGDLTVDDGRLVGIDGGDTDNVICFFQDRQGNDITDAAGNAGIPLPRDYVADASFAAYGKEFYGMVEGSDKTTIKDHLMNLGVDPDAPTDERRADKKTKAQQVLGQQRDAIEAELAQMEENAKDPRTGIEDPALKNNETYKQRQYLLAVVDNAELADGDWSPIVQKAALEQMRNRGGVSQVAVERLLRSDTQDGAVFSKEVTTAQENAQEFFNDTTDIPEAKREEFIAALSDPSKFCDLLLNDETLIPMSDEILKKIYGTLGETKIEGLVQNILDTGGHLTPEVRSKIDQLKSGAKGAGILALLLAAIPVAVAAISIEIAGKSMR